MKRLYRTLASIIAFNIQLCSVAQSLPVIKTAVFRKDTISILKHGAVADGAFLNSKAINAAINACSAKGGGVVLVPKGLWLTGPVVLKNNVNLHLAAGATLLFTT